MSKLLTGTVSTDSVEAAWNPNNIVQSVHTMCGCVRCLYGVGVYGVYGVCGCVHTMCVWRVRPPLHNYGHKSAKAL